ncbi:hypothetical protein P4V54_09325 [Brevibacillus nitrificans]|uniref:hypothetical protein n=1 Tax=Brevibacillus nitrificans TaxID=651560 RepID=UPI002E1F4B52|nr:hypothetical protein [Brevibacillus nitrificans]
MAQLPTNASIKDVIRELQVMEAINQKADLVSVVGSPAASGDSVAQVISKLINAKATLATNLQAKGQDATAADSVQSLADKVGTVPAKRWATGISASLPASTSAQDLVITGLGFKPSVIIAQALDVNITNPSVLYTSYWADSSYGWPGNTGNAAGGYSNNTSTMQIMPALTQTTDRAVIKVVTQGSVTRYRWIAFE